MHACIIFTQHACARGLVIGRVVAELQAAWIAALPVNLIDHSM